jgi:hypothetical protein
LFSYELVVGAKALDEVPKISSMIHVDRVGELMIDNVIDTVLG